MSKTEAEWQKRLTPLQYRVLRQKGTEAPFSGEHLERSEKGMYVCAACGNQLFKSDTKFKSTTPGLQGWPSFSEIINAGNVELKDDNTAGMQRIEVVCKKCGSHLGHLFDDEQSPNGKHYCVNSAALQFMPEKKK
jgi:peptide-methionine (R)-S-oxide reductase